MDAHTQYHISSSSSSLCHNHKECQLQNYLQLPHGRHHLHGRSPCRQHSIITITLCIYSHAMLHYDHQRKVIFFTKSPVYTNLPTWASFEKMTAGHLSSVFCLVPSRDKHFDKTSLTSDKVE